MRSLGLVLIVTGAATATACGGGGGFADAAVDEPPAANGTVSLQWTVKDAQGVDVPCSDINAQAVTITLRNLASQGGSTEVFGCSSTNGQSPGYPPGMYRIDFELTGPEGVLSTAPQQMVEIKSGQNTPLTPLDFEVDPTGSIDINLSTNLPSAAAPQNCAAGQGDIASLTLTLERSSDLSCAQLSAGGAVTFAVSAGSMGGTATTYTVNCTTPVVLGCVQADQRFTVSGVRAGGYRFHVRAEKAGGTGSDGECYVNDDTIAVPAAGNTRTQTLNLTLATGISGC